MKPLFLMITLIVCGCQALFAQANPITINGVTVTVSSKHVNATNSSKYNLNTCEESFVLFSFNNTTSSAIDNFVISTQANTDVLMLYAQLADPNLTFDEVNRSIAVTSIPVGTSSLQVPIKASCENFKSVTHSSISTLTFDYHNASVTQSQNLDFVISSGVIDYTSSDDTNVGENISYTGHKGDVFRRKYNFTVTETSFNGVLHLEEIIPSSPTPQLEIISLELVIDNQSQWIKTTDLIDPVTHNVSLDIVLDNVRKDAIIEIFEWVKIIGCPTGTGKLTFTYGCETSSCIVLRQMDLATNLGPERPQLTITDLNLYDFGTCLASSEQSNNNIVKRKFRLTNEGLARANNVYTSLRGGNSSLFGINIVPASSIKVTGSPQVLPSSISHLEEDVIKLSDMRGFETNANGSDICFQNDLMIYNQGSIRVLVLEPGEYIEIEWEERTCCVSNDKTNNYRLNAYGLMDTKCDNECGGYYGAPYWFGTDDHASIVGASVVELSGINNMFGCFTCSGGCGSNPAGTCDDNTLNNPLAPSSDYTETLRFKNSGFKLFTPNAYDFFPIDYKKVRLVVEFAVDGKLLLAPHSTANRGNIIMKDGKGLFYTPSSQTILTNSEILASFGTSDIPANATDAGARAVFEIDPEAIFGVGSTQYITTYKNTDLEQRFSEFVNSLEITFEVSGVCDRPTSSTGPSNYFERMYLVPDGDDCPDCKLSIASYKKDIIVNCPGCIFPGVLVNGYDVERITVGEADVDNNGLRDDLGVTSTGAPNLKMVTDNDIIKAKTRTTLWSGTARTYGSGATFGSLEQDPGFSNRFLTNFAKLDLIGPYGNFIDVLVSADHPIVVDYKQAGKTYNFIFTSNSGNINSGNIWSSNGTGNFLFQFPISLIREKLQSDYGFSTSQAAEFNYEANDVAEITTYYKIKPNFDFGTNKYYESIDVSTRCFYSDRLKDVWIDMNNVSDPSSPYGISGSLDATQASELKPYLNYICEAYGTRFILADLKDNFAFYGAGSGNNAACVKGLGIEYTISGEHSNTGQALDLFPYELRTFNRLNEVKFVLPKGYKIDYTASYLANQKSYRHPTSFDYIIFNEHKYFKDIPLQAITRTNVYQNNLSGQPILVGENIELNIEYSNQLTYTSQVTADVHRLGSNDKFTDANEFGRMFAFIQLIPDCSEPILDYFQYSDDPAVANANWVDYNQYFVLEGPKAVVNPYDLYTKTLTNNYVTAMNASLVSGYSRPSAALWGGSASPIVSITKVVANVDIFKKVSKVPFKLTATDQSANVFMYFTTKNGKVILGDLIKTNPDNTTQLYSKVQGVYQLGNLTNGQLFDFNLEVQFQCNDVKDDELYLHVGYTCDNSYPTLVDGSLDKAPCGMMNESIRIIESSADLSVNYSNTATCSNVSHEVKITSLLDGGLYDFKPTIQLPLTLTYKSGSAKLQAFEIINNLPIAMKDALGGDILFTLPDPIVTAPNILSWDLTDLAGLDDLYIHGGGYALLTFDSDPACGATSGVVNASVIATTYCNIAVSKALVNPANVVFAPSCSPVLTILGSNQVCSQSSGMLTAQLSGPAVSNDNYTWYKSINGTRELLSGPSALNTYSYNNLTTTATFEVIVSSTTCTFTSSILVTVNNPPAVSITSPVEFCIGSSPLALSGSPAGGQFTGNGVSLTSTSAYVFTSSIAGNSNITYTYTDPSSGCTNAITKTIVVSACCKYALATTEVMCGEDAVRCITLKAIKPVDDGIKGMDFILHYDRTLMRPTGIPGRGNATLGNVVLNGGMTNGMGSYAMTERTISGTNFNELHVSIFYNGQAPAAADFDGIGDVICIEFKINGTSTTNLGGTSIPAAIIIGDFYQGAFSKGVVDDEHKVFMIRSCVENNGEGILSILKNNFLQGRIYYHNDVNAPLRYDAATTPSPYLKTTVQAITTNYGFGPCTPSSIAAETTNMNGAYKVDLTGANGLKITRDITGDYYNSCTDPSNAIDQSGNVYMPANPASLLVAINGYDAYLMESISTMRDASDVVFVANRKVPGAYSPFTATSSFPSAFQMIASDVNMDRMVRAVDISLVQERAVSKLCEYPQVWNYNLGVDPAVYPLNTQDQRSLDWRFVSKDQVTSNLSYQKSGIYPLPAGTTGTSAAYYWRDNVPSPSICMMAPWPNPFLCKSFSSSFDIHAIMLGDIDGSWRSNMNNAQQTLRTVSDRQVIINAKDKRQIGVNTYRIPVSFVSQDPKTVSLDFALDYNENELSIQSVGNLEAATNANAQPVYNDFEHKQLLFTSFTMTGFNSSTPIYYLDVVTKNGDFTANMLGSGDAYLNGEKVSLVVDGATITGIDNELLGSQYGFELIPNPAASIGEIVYNIKGGSKAKIVVYNTLGQTISEYTDLEGQGSLQVGTSDWSSGMYQVILFTENSQKLIKKWVIQK